jgi:predicted CoA-binding protein
MDEKFDLLKSDVIWAVVGASTNEDKYGFKIYKKLKKKGYKVYAVNPNCTEVLGDKCYPNLSALPEKVNAINMVVPAKIGLQVVEEANELGIENIWFQPGSESKELITYCNENNLNPVQACILVALRTLE